MNTVDVDKLLEHLRQAIIILMKVSNEDDRWDNVKWYLSMALHFVEDKRDESG
jgi:hypothetical protein